jgi:hypothetical protein
VIHECLPIFRYKKFNVTKHCGLLGVVAKYYPQSKIMVITKDKYELIVRADSNGAFENRVKNPIPVKAAS